MTQSKSENKLLKMALWYAQEKNWPVLALHSIRNGRCSCSKGAECDKPGKHPRWMKGTLEHGAKSATTNPDIIKSWWKKWPDANVGIATGARSFDVLDVDIKGDGPDTLADLEVKHGRLPDTIEQITGSGGRQIMFQPCGKIGNAVRFADGLDTRSDGGLVVVPPSMHISGNRYEWEVSSLPNEKDLAPFPEWLIREINRKKSSNGTGDRKQRLENGPAIREKSSNGTGDRKPVDVQSIFDEGIEEGRRDQELYRYACRLRSQGMSRQEAEVLVQEAAARCKPPFPPDEARKKVEQAWKHPAPEFTEVAPSEDREECAKLIDECLQQDFLNIEMPPREWLIQDLLYEGQNAMFFSKPGVGKTNMALALAAACSCGGAIFGPYRVNNPVSVLYIDAEMPAVEMQERLKRLWIKPDMSRFKLLSSELLALQCQPVPNLLDPVWRGGIYKYLSDNQQFKLLVLDNLSSLTPGIDENSGSEWDGINQWLLELRRMGLSNLVIHHAGKNNAQRGTSKREDQMDLILRFSEIKDRQVATFRSEFQKARSLPEKLKSPFVIERHDHGENMVLVYRAESEDKLARIAFLVSRGWTQKDIAAAVGMTQGAVSKKIKKARGEGLLTEDGHLTPAGEFSCVSMAEE